MTVAKRAVKVARKTSQRIRIALHRRPFQAFGLGAAKTGTTALAKAFANDYRSEHEPDAREVIDYRCRRLDAAITVPEVEAWLLSRDRRNKLALEASHPMVWFADCLPRLFPQARYLLTWREPRDWLRSQVNQNYTRTWRDKSGKWPKLMNAHYPKTGYTHHDRALEAAGLPSVNSYLRYYASHYEFALEHLPHDRVLALNLQSLAANLDGVATFIGATQVADPGIRNQASSYDFDIDEELDDHYLSDVVEQHCRVIEERVGALEPLREPA